MQLLDIFPCMLHLFCASFIVCYIVNIQTHGGVDGCKLRTTTRMFDVEFSRKGTLNIGVIMSLHNYKHGVLCGPDVLSLSKLQQMESISFAIQEINHKQIVHPNITLGFIIVDDCSNELTAIAKTLLFIQNAIQSASANQCVNPVRIVALISPDSSSRTLKIEDIASIMEVTEISLWDTFRRNKFQNTHTFVFRTTPSDLLQVRYTSST